MFPALLILSNNSILMKFIKLNILLFTLLNINCMSQKPNSDKPTVEKPSRTLSGEYHFNKMELASGFNFTPDGKFQFYYVYGASDRNATGTYTIKGDSLFLKSDKEGGKDFVIDKQSKRDGNITIRISSPNPYLASGVACMCLVDGKEHPFESDKDGLIETDLKKCDQLFVQHLMFPDAGTLIADKDNDNNYFELSLSPSLQQVSFKWIDFVIKDDVITCGPNYFLPFEDIEYVKAQ